MDNEETPLKQIRTFQGDVAEALRKQKESLVSIQQAEYLRRKTATGSSNLSSEVSSRRINLFFLYLGSFLLFALGLAGTWFAYIEYTSRATNPIIEAPSNRFITANAEFELDATDASRETLINTFSNTIANIPDEDLWHIILRKGVGNEKSLLETKEFLEILGSQAPSNLVRAFNPLFMLGALGKNPDLDSKSVFLIVKLDSFENTFAGMLSWEKSLAQDMGPLFASSNLLYNLPPESTFSDFIDNNKDIRAIMFEGRAVFLYTFFDNNMLVITDNILALRILLDRLTREKLSR